jgi:hypothetical protein
VAEEEAEFSVSGLHHGLTDGNGFWRGEGSVHGRDLRDAGNVRAAGLSSEAWHRKTRRRRSTDFIVDKWIQGRDGVSLGREDLLAVARRSLIIRKGGDYCFEIFHT